MPLRIVLSMMYGEIVDVILGGNVERKTSVGTYRLPQANSDNVKPGHFSSALPCLSSVMVSRRGNVHNEPPKH